MRPRPPTNLQPHPSHQACLHVTPSHEAHEVAESPSGFQSLFAKQQQASGETSKLDISGSADQMPLPHKMHLHFTSRNKAHEIGERTSPLAMTRMKLLKTQVAFKIHLQVSQATSRLDSSSTADQRPPPAPTIGPLRKPLPPYAATAMVVPTQENTRHFQAAGSSSFTDRDYVTAPEASDAASKELISIPDVTPTGLCAEDNTGSCEVAGTPCLPSSWQPKIM